MKNGSSDPNAPNPGGNGGSASNSTGEQLFPNQLPNDLVSELAQAAQLGVFPKRAGDSGFEDLVNAGTIKWVVLATDELIVGPHTVKGVEISHAVLSGGNAVRAAGQAEIAAAGGQNWGLQITVHSGHFVPSDSAGMNLLNQQSEQIGREAFRRVGIEFP